MTKHSNVIDEILDKIQARKWLNDDGVEQLGTIGHAEAKQSLATELVRMMEEAIGETKPYKSGQFSYWEAKRDEKAETRTRLTAIIERELS